MKHLIFILITLLVSACNTTENFVRSDTPPTEIPEYQRLRIAYLGKEVLSYRLQNYLTQKVMKKELEIAWMNSHGVSDATTASVTLSAPIFFGHSLFSSDGMDIAGDALAAMVAADIALKIVASSRGMKDIISRFYMPSVFNDEPVSSPEEAFVLAEEHTLERFKAFASKNNYTWSCYDRCKKSNKIYFFKDEVDIDNFYVITNFYTFEKGTGDTLIHALLGYEPKWETKSSNGWVITIADDIERNPDGSISYKKQTV